MRSEPQAQPSTRDGGKGEKAGGDGLTQTGADPTSIWTPPQLGTTVPRACFLNAVGSNWRGVWAAPSSQN